MVTGLSLAAFVLFGGALSTVACIEKSPDWVYYILLAAALALGAVAALDDSAIDEAVRDMGNAIDLHAFSCHSIAGTVFSGRITARKL